jgi:hypothetical protein
MGVMLTGVKPLSVFLALRAGWPESVPLSVRFGRGSGVAASLLKSICSAGLEASSSAGSPKCWATFEVSKSPSLH